MGFAGVGFGSVRSLEGDVEADFCAADVGGCLGTAGTSRGEAGLGVGPGPVAAPAPGEAEAPRPGSGCLSGSAGGFFAAAVFGLAGVEAAGAGVVWVGAASLFTGSFGDEAAGMLFALDEGLTGLFDAVG